MIPIADDCDTAGIDIGARIVAQVIDTDSYPPRVAVAVLREGHRLVGVSPLRAAEGTTVRYMDARWTGWSGAPAARSRRTTPGGRQPSKSRSHLDSRNRLRAGRKARPCPSAGNTAGTEEPGRAKRGHRQ